VLYIMVLMRVCRADPTAVKAAESPETVRFRSKEAVWTAVTRVVRGIRNGAKAVLSAASSEENAAVMEAGRLEIMVNCALMP
jgi:hypothetical protein